MRQEILNEPAMTQMYRAELPWAIQLLWISQVPEHKLDFGNLINF
jgi:hypothetical protein